MASLILLGGILVSFAIGVGVSAYRRTFCPKGGKHDWQLVKEFQTNDEYGTHDMREEKCSKCGNEDTLDNCDDCPRFEDNPDDGF